MEESERKTKTRLGLNPNLQQLDDAYILPLQRLLRSIIHLPSLTGPPVRIATLNRCWPYLPTCSHIIESPPVPFEVPVWFFKYLDRKDLPSVCLTSKPLNSVTTPVLYRNVTCTPVFFGYCVSCTMLYSCTL